MQNRAAIDWQTETERERPWETDAHPGVRLVLLFIGMVLPLLGIAGRYVWVQTCLTHSYAVDFDRTSQKTEPIPTQDGRILAANGEVLAEDVLQMQLAVHFRWLQDPPHPTWLKQQALSRLEKSDRRNKERIQQEIETLKAEQMLMWVELARVSGLSPEKLLETRHEIQRRVERIREKAEETRWARDVAAVAPAAPIIEDASDNWWRPAWNTLVTTLTTPPRRESEEPIVVSEELAYHVVIPDLDPDLATRIENRPSQFPGVRIRESTRRVYPHSRTAPHVVGYRKPIDLREIARRREAFPDGDPLEYQELDRIGVAGIEKAYDSILRGLRGQRTLTLNRHGQVIRSEVTRPRRPGRDVILTLDLAFQQAVEHLLDEVLTVSTVDSVTGEALPLPPGGSLIALDVRTGAVLACATGPRFDVMDVVEPTPEGWQALISNPRTPLHDRSLRMELPPGSVFKAISAIALLQAGHLDPEAPFHCQGYLERPDQFRCYTFRRYVTGHNDVTLVDALARSCNVYFFSHARRMGPEPLHEWAAKFEFGQKTGVDLPGERAGRLPPPRPPRDGRRTGDTLQLSIGQGDLTVTPMQVARMMAAIANGGSLVTPHFVESTEADAERLQLVGATEPAFTAEKIPGLSSRSLAWVKLGLQKVVADPQGTGYKTVRMKEVAIAGKTGTAEPGGGKPDHAWFAGYVPAEKPRIAFVVVLQHAGSGGHAAGPVAKKFVQSMIEHGLLPGLRVAGGQR